jgi:mannitol/fructose-specific phosphotransferase system IIA component (Ntr-type)
MRLEPILHAGLVAVLEGRSTRDDVLRRLASLGAAATPGIRAEGLVAAFLDRESKFPTATPEGVAFPHALVPGVTGSRVAVVLARPGVAWGATPHPPQDLAFGIIGAIDTPWEHVRVLARLARIARGPGALDRLRAARDAADLFARLIAEDRQHG